MNSRNSAAVLRCVLMLAVALSAGYAQKQERAVVVTVLPFRTMAVADHAYLGDSFSEAVTTKLVGLRQVKVYERSQFDRLAGELRLEKDQSGFFDQDSLSRMGAVVSIDYALLGSVTLAGTVCTCSARLVHVNTGKVQLAKEFRGTYPRDLFALQDRLSLAVAQALSLQLNELDLKRIARAPTKDENAFSLYNKALAGSERNARIALLREAIGRDASFFAARHLLADLYVAGNEYDQAVAVYGDILAGDPADFRAAYNQGLLYLDQGAVAEAKDRLRLAAELKPGDGDVYYHLGLCNEFGSDGIRYAPGADLEAAAVYYAQAAALDPLHRESRLALGMVHASRAQAEADPARRLASLEESAAAFQAWLALAQDDPQAPEISANLHLIQASIAEHENYLESVTKRTGN